MNKFKKIICTLFGIYTYEHKYEIEHEKCELYKQMCEIYTSMIESYKKQVGALTEQVESINTAIHELTEAEFEKFCVENEIDISDLVNTKEEATE